MCSEITSMILSFEQAIWLEWTFFITRLHKAVVCEISISYHTKLMGNGVTQLTFTCSKSTIEALDKSIEYDQR